MYESGVISRVTFTPSTLCAPLQTELELNDQQPNSSKSCGVLGTKKYTLLASVNKRQSHGGFFFLSDIWAKETFLQPISVVYFVSTICTDGIPVINSCVQNAMILYSYYFLYFRIGFTTFMVCNQGLIQTLPWM